MNERNRVTRVGRMMRRLCLWVFLAALLLGSLQGAPLQSRQPQPSTAKPTRLTFSQREARGMDEIVAFLRRIGNQDGAKLISDWRSQNKIRAEDTPGGSASFDRQILTLGYGSYVAVSPTALYAAVDAQGNVNMEALIDLAGSLVHEMIHSGQGVTFWALANYKSQNQAERDAYFGALSIMASWINSLQQEVDAKAGRPPCDSLKDAADLKAACASFLKYDDEIQQFSKENRPALEARVAERVKPLQARRDGRHEESLAVWWVIVSRNQLTNPQRAKRDEVLADMVRKGELTEAQAKGDDWAARERAARKRKEPIDKEIASLDAQIAEVKKELDQPVFDVNSFTWTDPRGKTLSRDQVRADVQARISNMDEIARRCEESKAQPPPIIYQGPSSSKLPDSLAACLCGCIGTTGAYGRYQPQPVADSPACLEPRYGPCTHGNWGCLRDYFPTSGPCFQSCVKAAGIDAVSAIRAISDLKIGNYESALSESSVILDRLPQPSPGMSLPQHVRRRAAAGDFEKVAGLAKLAAQIYPQGKASADQKLEDLSMRVLPSAGQALETMDFETSTAILDALCVAVPANKEAAERRQQVKQWRQDWADLQRAVPRAVALAREGKPCQARALFDDQVQPRYQSLRVPITWANPLGSPLASSQFLPMPQRDKLVGDATAEVSAKSASCEAWAFKQTESLRGYVQAARSFGYRGTPPEQVARVIQSGEKLLADPNMCDCQRVKVEELVRDARASLQKERAGAVQDKAAGPLAETPPASPVGEAAYGSGIEGSWEANCNNYKGSLEFTRTPSGWTGRINLDGVWENLANIRFDSSTGALSFDRSRVGQKYEGRLAAGRLNGTFDRVYKWSAARAGATEKPAASSPVSTGAGGRQDPGGRELAGGRPPAAEGGKLAIDFARGTNGNVSPHWSLGFEFRVSEPITVVALAVWDELAWNPPGKGFDAQSQQVGLWKSDGTLLASAFVSRTDPTIGGGSGGNLTGKWRFHSIQSVTLSPGKTYVVASQGGEPMVYNPLNPVWDPRVTYVSNRVKDVGPGNPNNPLVFPSGSEGGGNPGYFGGNFLIASPTPPGDRIVSVPRPERLLPGVSNNVEEIIELRNLDLRQVRRIRFQISQCSEKTLQGDQDSARIGEVEFYAGTTKLVPGAVRAESTYRGYDPRQTIDGNRTYAYLTSGARGWASEGKGPGEKTWIEFDFEKPVEIDRIVVTTAPTRPYRLNSFQVEQVAMGPAAGE